MTRIIRKPRNFAARSPSRLVVATLLVGALNLGVSAAHAAFTTPPCLAAKLKAAGTLRACRAAEGAKQILGKVGDLAKCEAKFRDKLAKLDLKAAKAGVGCRYRDNGDGTVTDFSTGLQWEKKDGADGAPALGNPHDVDNAYGWSVSTDGAADGPAFGDFLDKLNRCTTADAQILGGGLAGYCDWRLPSVVELQSILKAPFPCGTSPCIDAIFGPTTVAKGYWSATTFADAPAGAWLVSFDSGDVSGGGKNNLYAVRAVRAGL